MIQTEIKTNQRKENKQKRVAEIRSEEPQTTITMKMTELTKARDDRLKRGFHMVALLRVLFGNFEKNPKEEP